jgi:ADP-ribosyltransferase exoenzyme
MLNSSDLFTPQKSIFEENLKNIALGKKKYNGENIVVAKTKNGYFVVEGNHRASSALIKGEKISANVFDLTKFQETSGEDEWSEADHPRSENGEFAIAGGSVSVSTLTNEEKEAIHNYTKHHFGVMNEFLRSDKQTQKEFPAKFRERIEMLEKILSKNRVSKTIHTYRGELRSEQDKEIENLKIGDKFNFKHFASTTTDPEIIGRFSNPSDRTFLSEDLTHSVEYKIRLPKGTKALPITNSKFEDEKEILLNRNQNFTVVDKRKENGKTMITLNALPSRN